MSFDDFPIETLIYGGFPIALFGDTGGYPPFSENFRIIDSLVHIEHQRNLIKLPIVG